MKLNSKKRAHLRKIAHNLEPIVRIGKDGFGENIKQSIIDAITPRELIKVKILQNAEDKEAITKSILEWSEVEIVGIVGGIVILYKENKDEPKVSLELKNL
ncbi:YhbY family RNA-binding protein [Fusobacterium sp. PH5-44]|uniref:YhbY family RNA-binding protein n=1 Tax=unclassified Fusobacterium TaxID=2648384 RepID=UPI003D1B8A02